MRSTFWAISLMLMATPVLADATVSGPQEVGTTTMPPGQYFISEQISHKSYSLTVTDKGNMILGPAPDGVAVVTGAATATAAGATNAATAAVAPVAATKASTLTSAAKGMMEREMEKGMSGLVKQGATKELENFIK